MTTALMKKRIDALDMMRGLVILLLSQHLPTEGAAPLPKLAAPFYRAVYSAVTR